jgi:peroxiredoxin family protein
MSNKKLSIVCFSGNFDKAIAAFTIASGAKAVGYEVNLFFTFWDLNIIKKKKGRNFLDKGILSKFFNFLMGGLKNLPLENVPKSLVEQGYKVLLIENFIDDIYRIYVEK